ncbi:MAG: Arm DNA-binding domain-containing protein [Leptospirillum sp.]
MAITQYFTQKCLETLLPKEKPYLVRDSEVKGLVVKVYPRGNNTFFLDVLVDRKHDWFKIGVWTDLNVAMVREKARKMRTDLAQGKNPKAEKKEGITLGEFFLVYMERHGSEKKSASKDCSHFEPHLKSWQNDRLVDITRSKV